MDISGQGKLLISFLQPVKKALLDKDVPTALKIIGLIEAMGQAAIDFDESNQLAETNYDAKVNLMKALEGEVAPGIPPSKK